MGNCLSPLKPCHHFSGEGLKVFTVAELKKATNNFGKDTETAESFNGVVKGYINPKTLSPAKEGLGMAVAVRKIFLANEQALQDWLVDLEFLRHNSHPSLVKLIGYCSDRDLLFIVSEYFQKGTLESHIYKQTRPNSLPWETRLKISIEAAGCLAFLHSSMKAGLYYTYPTASKILLDSNFNARVSYLGLKRVSSLDHWSHVSSHADEQKRFHYAPPEYIFSGMSHMAGDVYSFGVILLEILTGFGKQRIIHAKRVIWNDEENIADMIDPDLENSYPLEAGRRMCKLIKQCLEKDPKIRPPMKEVLDHLNAISQI